MQISANPSRVAVQMLTFYFQLDGDKHRRNQIAGCIHMALERGQILPGIRVTASGFQVQPHCLISEKCVPECPPKISL